MMTWWDVVEFWYLVIKIGVAIGGCFVIFVLIMMPFAVIVEWVKRNDT